MKSKITQQTVDMASETIKGMLRGGLSIKQLGAALHNTFYHGEIFGEIGMELDDKDKLLGDLYKGIEEFSKGAQKIEEFNN
jgi:hypothetical protein